MKINKVRFETAELGLDGEPIHGGFTELTKATQRRYHSLYKRLQTEQTELLNVFLIPAADPLKPAKDNTHNRSLYSKSKYVVNGVKSAYAIKGAGLSSPHLSGRSLVAYAPNKDIFDGGYDEDELYDSIAATITLRQAYKKHRNNDPNIMLAEFFKADIDTFTKPVAGFKPIFLPKATEGKTRLVDADTLLKEIGIDEVFITKMRFYLYRCTIPTRMQELGDIDQKDAHTWNEFFNRIGYKRKTLLARHEILFQAAARYALSIHIGHDILGRAFYKEGYGGVFDGAHNTNPFVIFDMDTLEEKYKTTLTKHMIKDLSGAISLIEELGKRLKLGEDSIKAATELFHEILLAERYEPVLVIRRLKENTQGQALRNYLQMKEDTAKMQIDTLKTNPYNSPLAITAIEGAA